MKHFKFQPKHHIFWQPIVRVGGRQCKHYFKVPKQPTLGGRMVSVQFGDGLGYHFICMGASRCDDVAPILINKRATIISTHTNLQPTILSVNDVICSEL
jgi:hypothetical protein